MTWQEGSAQGAVAPGFPQQPAQPALRLLSCAAHVWLQRWVTEADALFFSVFLQQNTSTTAPTIQAPASFKAVSQREETYFCLLSCYSLVAESLAGS